PPRALTPNGASPAMAVPRHDVLCIGNAIVDVIARTEEDFLIEHQMIKGSMALIDEARAETIYAAMGPATVISGGAAGNPADDVDAETVQAAKIAYFEGYLWDPPAAKDAIRRAAAIAHEAGREVAITLSDSFCVDRYRDDFLFLIRTRTVDLVFANEHELLSL